jgi:hypothetical protein
MFGLLLLQTRWADQVAQGQGFVWHVPGAACCYVAVLPAAHRIWLLFVAAWECESIIGVVTSHCSPTIKIVIATDK